MSRRSVVLVTLTALATFVLGAWLLQRGASHASGAYGRARVFSSIVERIADLYVDSIEPSQLYDLAIDGMLRNLDDPYTEFLRADDLEDLILATRGDYSGLGVRIEVTDGWLTVVTPLVGTPADEAGIEPGDRIVEVDGVVTYRWSPDKASAALRGDPGTTVAITVVRAGLPDPLRLEIGREQIHVTSVRHAAVVAPDIGYVRLETVGAQSAEELTDAVSRLRDSGARKLILDLRFNPGGLLTQGVAVSELFLEPGEAVVSTRGRAGVMARTYDANLPRQWGGMPLAVLVNEFSASAAEIIAGALQDHDRALVLGTPSFGKGMVQTIFQISRTEALRLTTGRWYTPSGRSIHRERDSLLRASPEDSTLASTVFRSDAGRELAGDGGIHPDVVVTRADTATAAERRFQRRLGSNIPTFLDVVSSYAMELKEAELVPDAESFEVTPHMRSVLLRRIRERGIAMPNTVWSGARDLVSHELLRRTLRYVFGREVEMRYEVLRDVVVGKAIELLGEVESQEELFELAGGVREEGVGRNGGS